MKKQKSKTKSEYKVKKIPDHHDAELVLELYSLRREPVMRESRKALIGLQLSTWEDIVAVSKPDHPHNAAWRQVTSYFEMAWSMARHGIAQPDFLAENTGEGFLLYAKIQPHLARFRREMSPTAFTNAEWMLANSASARQRFEMFQARFAKLAAAASK